MKIRFLTFLLLFSLLSLCSFSQEGQPEKNVLGFIRAGFYGNTGGDNDRLSIPSAFTDLDLKLGLDDNKMFRAYADLRFRYGTEFNSFAKDFDLREAYVGLYGKTWDITTGQQIIKWGKTDFTNAVSKVSSRNLVSRSPDPEDMDMGNLMIRARWYPLSFLQVEFVASPFYHPSVLITGPLKLPAYITINQPEKLFTGSDMFSYGFRSDLHLSFADFGISWFDGYDPMPGIKLTSFNIDMSLGFPVPFTELSMTPYKIKNGGIDFETTAGSFGIRRELALTHPEKSFRDFEYYACKQILWVIGADRSIGKLRILGEYSGKYLPGFEASAVDPILGSEPDLSALASLLSSPGFDLQQYVKQQVGAFNRLYNYQLKKQYHSGAIRIERELLYGMMTPSVTGLYNVTTNEFMLRPELVYKPADGITINVGGEIFSGRKGSVYDIVDDFLNGFFLSLKAEF